MRKTKLVISILFIALLKLSYGETWESNVANFTESDFLSHLENSFGVPAEGLKLKSDHYGDIGNIAFLVRSPFYDTLDQVSSSYRDVFEKSEGKPPVPRVKYDDFYSVFRKGDESEPYLTVRLTKEQGWGANRDSFVTLRESYLIEGGVTEGSLQWVRPREDGEYEELLLWSTLTKPEDFKVVQINPDLWVYSYTHKIFFELFERKDPIPRVRSVIYSEKYGLSIIFEADFSTKQEDQVNDRTMLEFGLSMATLIFDEIDKKGVVPSKEFIHFMHERRKKKTGSIQLPDYVIQGAERFSTPTREREEREQLDLAEKVENFQVWKWLFGALTVFLILVISQKMTRK